MVRYLMRKMLRDIRKSASSYLVAAVIVAVGIMGYSVLSIAARQLEQSKQYLFEETSFCEVLADVRQAPLAVAYQLEEIEGVQMAQGRIVQNVRVADKGINTEFKLISVEAGKLNLPLLSRGSLPQEGQRQIVVGDAFFKAHNLEVGQEVNLLAAGRKVAFTVTGSGISPENIYIVKNIAELLPTPDTYDAAFMDYPSAARLLSMDGLANNFVFLLEEGAVFEEVKEEIERVLKPYGCSRVYERKDELSVSVLEMELDSLSKVTTVIPMLFLSISAIILSISLHRLIEQQRTQIGTLMALGVPTRVIVLHYTGYGAAVGFAGGLAGGVYGNIAAGPMADFYRVYFSLPSVPQQISLRFLFVGIAVATCFCALVGGISVRASGKLMPAEALRPAPPKDTHRLFLERIPGFLALFTVPGKMAVRSIARNPRRSMLSLFGIACAYMITATLVSMNTMFDVFLFDYLEKNQQQDVTVSFTAPVSSYDALRAVRSPEIIALEGVVEVPMTLRGKSGELDCLVQGISEDSTLCLLYDEEGRNVKVTQDGIVISLHMAGQLGVSTGDWLEVVTSFPQEQVSRLPVVGVVAQYMGSTAYMSHEGIGRVSAYRDAYTSVLIKAPAHVREELLAHLDSAQQVATVQSRQERIEQYRGMMGSISGIMAAMAMMGVLVGFAVIYTSSLISFEELKREIATLRMLGVSDKQCLDTISVSQWILTCGAIVLGIPMTVAVSRLMSATIATEMFTIPNFVDTFSLLASIALTFVAVAWSNRVIYRKLRKITPVELLRERE